MRYRKVVVGDIMPARSNFGRFYCLDIDPGERFYEIDIFPVKKTRMMAERRNYRSAPNLSSLSGLSAGG
jgi:hypothetical protein